MATGNVGVNISVITGTAADVRAEKTTMKNNLTAISDGVSTLRGSWQSEAANSLSTIASKMSSRFSDLERAVESFAVFLDGVAANYTATEQRATQDTQSVESLFN